MTSLNGDRAKTWTFKEFVECQSKRFPHLVPLAEFLQTRSIAFSTDSLPIKLQSVNVVVLDIRGDISRSVSGHPQHFGNVEGLANFVNSGIPDHVSLRLYLVEDMTPPVIEILGTALKCHPDVFGSHLQHLSGWITTISGPQPPMMATTDGLIRERRRLTSSKLRSSHFSLPFRRQIPTAFEKHPGRFRTMYRACEKHEKLLEERVSAAMIKAPDSKLCIGLFLFDSLPRRYFPYSMRDDEDVFHNVPAYQQIQSSLPVFRGPSFRERFVSQILDTDFQVDHWLNEVLLLTKILKVICYEWKCVIESNEALLGSNHIGTGVPLSHWVNDIQRRSTLGRENTVMLEGCLSLIKKGSISARRQSDQGLPPNQYLADLEEDFHSLVKQNIDQVERIERQLALLAALYAIEESKKSIQEAENIRYLETLQH
ncbi:hypothetical protein MMC27_001890 [Xylographa pallens]|nr:hypothetical protein [Xylographa pallens]